MSSSYYRAGLVSGPSFYTLSRFDGKVEVREYATRRVVGVYSGRRAARAAIKRELAKFERPGRCSLKSPKGRGFCVPTAIARICRKPIRVVEQWLRLHNPELAGKDIRGVNMSGQALPALVAEGYRVASVFPRPRGLGSMPTRGTFLVASPRHAFVLHNGKTYGGTNAPTIRLTHAWTIEKGGIE